MKYIISQEIEDIIQIYSEVFLSPFPSDEYEEKQKKGYKVFPVKFILGDKLVGFCFVLDKRVGSKLHCWIGGVLSNYRKTGIFGGFIDWIVNFAYENKYEQVTLHTDNNKPDIIRLLVKYGFDIIDICETKYGDGKKIKFCYNILPKRKMRLSITDRCNMNCFFCHSEGNYTPNQNNMSLSALDMLLTQARKMNFTEITITGGEPLTYFDGVSIILSNCNKWVHPPKIKICSNGVLLYEKKLQMIKEYKGKIEFNISLHTVEPDEMVRIAGVKLKLSEYDRVFNTLYKHNIDFRINSVILKGINDSSQSLFEFFEYAFNNNISDVHLLELLVTKKQSELLKYYESIDRIEEKINSLTTCYRIETKHKTNKKRMFMIYDNDKCIKVVLYRLSCRCGCENCLTENDVKIGADMRLHPCYLDQGADCGNAVSNLKRAVKCRDEYISTRNSNFFDELLYWGE